MAYRRRRGELGGTSFFQSSAKPADQPSSTTQPNWQLTATDGIPSAKGTGRPTSVRMLEWEQVRAPIETDLAGHTPEFLARLMTAACGEGGITNVPA
jgi:hypothetical protein